MTKIRNKLKLQESNI